MRDSALWETPEDDTKEARPAARPPVLPRDTFEVYEGLRETTLGWLNGAKDCETVRYAGKLLSSLAETKGEPAESLREQALAGLVDLRHVQETFAILGGSLEDDENDPFLRRCERFAVQIGKLAERLAGHLSAPSPRIKPHYMEEPGGFRETTLARFSDPEARRLLRQFGNLLCSMAMEYRGSGDFDPEGWLCHDVRAAVADLRHLQGHFHRLGRMPETLTDPGAALLGHCRSLAEDVQRLADKLEKELEAWRSKSL